MPVKVKIIPTKEATYDAFMTNLYKQVNLNAEDWNILPEIFEPSELLLSNWEKSYDITKNPNTSTSVDVTRKDLDKAALTKFSRTFIAKYIYLNGSMEDDDLKLCGITPHHNRRTHAGKPSTLPMMEFKAGNGHNILAYYRQQMSEPGSTGRGKPDGVGSIQHTTFIGTEHPADPKNFGNIIIGTRSPTAIPFDAEDAGKMVWISSRWVSTNNINGDWTTPICMQIP